MELTFIYYYQFQLKRAIKIQHTFVQNKFWNTNTAVEPKLKLLTNKSETGVLTQTYRTANANMYVVKKAHLFSQFAAILLA